MNYKRSLAHILAAAVPVHPICSLAASYHSESNPVGEQVYAAHSLTRLLPVGIIVCALLLAWLLARISGKTRKPAADDAESHQC
jgi:hypothetical protein